MLHAPAARADVIGKITLDTSALVGEIVEVVLVLTDGSGIDDANNVVKASGFTFGTGGSAGAVDSTITTGGASGGLVTGISLVDGSFLNVFAAFFTAGSLLSFDFEATTGADIGLTPDQFSFLLLNVDGRPIATSDPSGANLLFVGDFGATSPVFTAFASEFIPAPVFTPALLAEPSSISLLALALGAFVWRARSVQADRQSVPG
jgi:hypothetical protein